MESTIKIPSKEIIFSILDTKKGEDLYTQINNFYNLQSGDDNFKSHLNLIFEYLNSNENMNINEKAAFDELVKEYKDLETKNVTYIKAFFDKNQNKILTFLVLCDDIFKIQDFPALINKLQNFYNSKDNKNIEIENQSLQNKLSEKDKKITSLEQIIAEKDKKITSLEQIIAEKDKKNNGLIWWRNVSVVAFVISFIAFIILYSQKTTPETIVKYIKNPKDSTTIANQSKEIESLKKQLEEEKKNGTSNDDSSEIKRLNSRIKELENQKTPSNISGQASQLKSLTELNQKQIQEIRILIDAVKGLKSNEGYNKAGTNEILDKYK